MGNSFRNIALAMLVMGAALKRPPVTVFGAFLLGVVILSRAISRLALGEVTYTRSLSSAIAFTGDSIDLTITVENKKPLPVPLVCDDDIPKALALADAQVTSSHKPGRGQLRNEMFLGGFETVTRKFHVTCPARGLYSVGPVRLSSGDPFGLYPVSSSVDQTDRLTVYPRVIPMKDPPDRSFYPFGTSRAPSWTYQDPSMLKMVREYAPGDSRRHTDWKATARSGKLQTRVFDATFGNRLVACLDLSTSRAPCEGIDRDLFESLVVATASICSHFSDKKFAVGLASNGVSQAGDGSRLAQCPPAEGSSHLAHILGSLAALSYYSFGTASAACQRPWVTSAGSFPIVITAIVDDVTLALLEHLRKSAPRTTVIVVDSGTRRLRNDEKSLRHLLSMPGVQALSGFLKGGWDCAEDFALSPLE